MPKTNFMSQCNFSIPFTITPAEVATKAKAAITNAGGQFVGNEQSGGFHLATPMGTVRGSYSIQGNVLNVVIESKPFFIGCGVIETQLRKYF
jgi:hypothetical protein